MLTIKQRLVAFSLLFVCSFYSHAQDSTAKKQKVSLKESINAKQFRFHAISARTQTGKTIQLTSDYYLLVNQDSLQVDLPYYGRAYTADYGSTDMSVRFSSVQFTYLSETKKDGWDLTITPKNQSKASKIFISVSSDGYTNISVTSSSRQAISYYGTIEGLKK